MPPEPEPSRFSDWSSLASPPTRTSPHGAPDVQTEQSEQCPEPVKCFQLQKKQDRKELR